jgi:hypothetical protein
LQLKQFERHGAKLVGDFFLNGIRIHLSVPSVSAM